MRSTNLPVTTSQTADCLDSEAINGVTAMLVVTASESPKAGESLGCDGVTARTSQKSPSTANQRTRDGKRR